MIMSLKQKTIKFNNKHLACKSGPLASKPFVFLDILGESLQVSPELGTVATWP